METERLRTAQMQAERTLEARERAHRQRVKGLEEQVSCNKSPFHCIINRLNRFLYKAEIHIIYKVASILFLCMNI